MHNLFRYFIYTLLTAALISCATPVKQPEEKISGHYKYEAWRLNSANDLEAINVLINDADRLIEKNSLEQATDKLERALRIKPEYAPAWSRLSWVALQGDSPARAIQMAKRSNSFAYSNPKLQLLNWSFIRAASQVLNDDATYRHAEQNINQLKSF